MPTSSPINKIKIAPSILAADFTNIKAEIQAVEAAGADMLHFDVMDGHFVPNISFGLDFVKQAMNITKLKSDIHLMIQPYEKYLENFAKLKPEMLSIHLEAGNAPIKSLQLIRQHGIKAGIAICPTTTISQCHELLDYVDFFVLMSVDPGFSNQSFLPHSISRLKELTKLTKNKNIEIEVDGGVNLENCAELTENGANILVAGSATFSNKKAYQETISQLRAVSPIRVHHIPPPRS